MSVTKMNDPVLYDGAVTTIGELDNQGLIEFEKCENVYSKTKGTVTKYFANIKGTESGWEIGKMAYRSRTGESVLKFEEVEVDGVKISKNAVRAYNSNARILFNDNWNLAHNLGTMKENVILRKVDIFMNGNMGNRISYEDVIRYSKK